jgi:hypothetical protein
MFGRGYIAFDLGKTTQKLVLFPLSPSESYFKHFCSIFLQYEAKRVGDILLFQVCHFLGIRKSQMEQHNFYLRCYSTITMLQLYSKQEMTQQTLFFVHLVVEVCASSSSITLSVQNQFDHFMYFKDLLFDCQAF